MRQLTPSELWRFHSMKELPQDYIAQLNPAETPLPPLPKQSMSNKQLKAE